MLETVKNVATKAITSVFGTKRERDVKRLFPVVEEIKAEVAQLESLSDEEIQAKTVEFRRRIAAGETADDLLPEAFAVVHEACRRNVGRSWPVVGHEMRWEMVPFDVQLMGAVVLHEGKIAEMATGEGKTLVALFPLYLNALSGKGCHLITVNDYLARRDSEWVGEILRWLGLTVGVIEHDMDSARRREAYNCDVTYATNNEVGFDYLRDNMAIRKEDQVKREHHYAIVDEVDSVLIDEARTPLIISGPVTQSRQRYDELRPRVESLVRAQNLLMTRFLKEAEAKLQGKEKDGGGADKSDEDGKDEYAAGVRMLQVRRGAPKNKRLLKMIADEPVLDKLVHSVESDFMRDKRLHELDEELYFSIDEKSNSINLSDLGREHLSPQDPDYFTLPDLSEELGAVDEDESLEGQEKILAREKVHQGYAEKSDELHSIHQLLKAYCLFEKDVNYVVQEGKVLIVDEFTGRLMPGRRFSEGLHQALEAKERVKVEGETQTWATITLQNYFRLYDKLAGMTGTAETESEEFFRIYKLDVIVIPTNEPVRRIDYDDLVYRTRREKYNAIMDEIEAVHQAGRPALVGTISVDVSETLSRMLKRRGINHNVLNAKQHRKEAEIVRLAGEPGAVTIATNMAGRGTDIRLGEGVVKGKECLVNTPEGRGDCQATESAAACRADMPCGLHIIGTERHESRRIDRQLRGRSGRQGDPGSSRFFLSLEDDLMRLFSPERLSGVLTRMGVQEGEVITHKLVTRAIEKAQKRVEEHNFGIRKHLIEYDDVMNQQREVVYELRQRALEGEELRDSMLEMVDEVVEQKLDQYASAADPDDWNLDEMAADLGGIFLHPFNLSENGGPPSREDVLEKAVEQARRAYEQREEVLGSDIMRQVERYVHLRSIDDRWKDHLYEIDQLKGGIGLRAYGQKDPLVEYKREAFGMFSEMMTSIQEETLRMLFRIQVGQRPAPRQDQAPDQQSLRAQHAEHR
ncbi:MAG: preprotein translocase subunit SecA, partial [Candidatus Eisenbacteria bacterium]|nr:preprotein translocase subunit SecA [Candidatus Eisenbacteria bacterium]